jgi:hypothetical protein
VALQILFMCLSIFNCSSNQDPRFFTALDRGVTQSPTCRASMLTLASCCIDPIRTNSVLSSFSLSRYDNIHSLMGASVAKWLAHLPFTSEAAGSSLSENFLNATRTQSSWEKSKSQRSAESRGVPPGTPFSSHRES